MADPCTALPRRLASTGAALLLALLATTACSADEAPPAPPEPTVTSLSDLDTGPLVPVRRDPCAGVPAAVLDNLGAGEDDVERWQPGQTLPDSAQVADEFGCRVSGDVTATAWVFAPPVSAREARGLLEEMPRTRCRPAPGPAFGSPGAAYSCDLEGGTQVHGVRGLLADAWVTCEVAGGDAATANRWCAAVLESLSTGQD